MLNHTSFYRHLASTVHTHPHDLHTRCPVWYIVWVKRICKLCLPACLKSAFYHCF